MGRKKTRKPSAPENQEQLVPVELSEEQINLAGRRLAALCQQRRVVERRRRGVTKECNDEIGELSEQISLLAEQITTGVEQRQQGDLFAGQGPPTREGVGQALAGKALAEVAARAEGDEPASGNGEAPEPESREANPDGDALDAVGRLKAHQAAKRADASVPGPGGDAA